VKILVDIGNTRTKYLFEQTDSLNTHFVIKNEEITLQWLVKHWGMANELVIASVKSGVLTETISQWSQTNNITCHFIESEKKRFGITNSYEQPKTLGVDRWLTLLGASALYPRTNVIIIDAGTATTFDLLDKSGLHQGGWILSGIELLFSQLNNSTSKVNFEINDFVDTGFGKSTSECVNNAAWAATIGMINTGIKKAQHAYNIDHCLLLGGNAEKIKPFVEFPVVEINNNLIFEGLKRY